MALSADGSVSLYAWPPLDLTLRRALELNETQESLMIAVDSDGDWIVKGILHPESVTARTALERFDDFVGELELLLDGEPAKT